MKTNSKWSPQDILWGKKKKNLFEKIRKSHDWDKVHVSIFIIYPIQSFLKKSFLEKSYRLLKFAAEVLNFSLGSSVGRRINDVREDHDIILFHLQRFCKLGGSCSCVLQVRISGGPENKCSKLSASVFCHIHSLLGTGEKNTLK